MSDRLRRDQESQEEHDQRLQRRRERDALARQEESQEQHEQRLERKRVSDRLRRHQESNEQRLQNRRESVRTIALRRFRHKTVEQFLADLKIPLDCCCVCQRLVYMYSDKTKKVSSTILAEVCPTNSFNDPVTTVMTLCSKCDTQIAKSQWPSWASTNDLSPDDIPIELAMLTSDEVRTISLICPFLKVILLPGGQFGEEGSVIHFPYSYTSES